MERIDKRTLNLEASVRSRDEQIATDMRRDLIEAGLSEPADGRRGYGDCISSGWSETPESRRGGPGLSER